MQHNKTAAPVTPDKLLPDLQFDMRDSSSFMLKYVEKSRPGGNLKVARGYYASVKGQ
jgi:hypothetical protein